MLQPLIKWPGGKSRMIRKLKRRIPGHRVYAEPFFGGGSFFFGKEPVPVSILGDVSPRTIRFHEQVRRGALRRCMRGIEYSRKAYKRALGGNSACDVFAQAAMSYHGNVKGWRGNYDPAPVRRNGSGRFGLTKFRHLGEYERRLRKAWLTQADFEHVVQLADRIGGKDAFYFLDPPWPLEYSKMYTGVKGKTDKTLPVARVKEVMDRVRGRAWVVYNFHPEVVRVFCRGRGRWRCYRVRTDVNKGNRNRGDYTLLAANYKVR